MEAVKQIRSKGQTAAAHAVNRKTMPGLSVATERKAEPAAPKARLIQPRLKVNKPGDSFEREADATADRVMRMSTTEKVSSPYTGAGTGPSISRAATAPVVPLFRSHRPTTAQPLSLSRKCAHCEEQEKKLQRKDTGDAVLSTAGDEKMKFVEKELSLSKSGGQPLPTHIRSFMGKSMGVDFSAVRIHTGGNAIAMNKAVHAHAFTHGKDIYFNSGMYDPDSPAGQHLLAHELTHVVQQGYAPAIEATGSQPKAEGATIQRWGLADLADLNPLEVDIDTLVRKYVPELVDIKQAGGLAPWIDKKITGAIESIMNAVMGPIKSAADFVSSLSPTLAKIINWIKTAGIKVSKNDCSSFTELATMIEQLVDELTAPAIEKIKEFAGKASAWCKDIWERFGVPVWDFIKKYVGDQWELIKSLASTIWQKTAPIREWAASVWIKFKNWLGIGDGPEGQNGILQWIEKKITDIWAKIKEKIEPFKKQLMVVAGVLVLLSPAGPILAAGAVFAVVFTALNWIRKNIHSPADIVKLRVKFEKEILPSLMGGLQKASAALKTLFGSLTGKLDAVLNVFGKLVSLVAGSILSLIQSALQWITGKLTELVEWATTKLTELGTFLQGIFDKVRAFVIPIIQFLEKVSAVANNVMDLPMLILGGLWKKVPSCIRVPVENFLVNVILKNVPFFDDIVAIANVWQKLKAGAMDIIKTVFVTGDLKGGVIKAFRLFLDIIGIPEDLVIGIYNKAKASFDEIVNRPKAIFVSIVAAMKAGFMKFSKNFLKNSLDAIGNWVFSKVKGVKVPKEFSIKSVFGMVLDILGITEDNIFERITKKKDKKFSDRLRAVYTTLKGAAAWIIDILKDPKAAYEKAKQHLKDLKTKLFESIGKWIATNVIGAFITEMIAMLATSPFGEVIEAIIDTYKMIKTAIEYAEKVLRIIDSVLDSILDLAGGVITKAVDTVEKGLVIGLEVAIAFMAKVISIGNLPTQVKKIVEQDIRPIVNAGIDAVIDGVIAVVQALKGFASDAKEALLDAFNWGNTKVPFTTAEGESHSIYFEKKGDSAVLMVASTPTMLTELVKEFEEKYKNNPAKLKLIPGVKAAMTDVKNAGLKIAALDAKLKKTSTTEDEKTVIKKTIDIDLQHLLVSETLLTMRLAEIMKKDSSGISYSDFENIYAIEGQVGIHGESPKSTKFNADHQPSNDMLTKASQASNAPPFLKEVVKQRTSFGFTIVLGVKRHYEGLTYGRSTPASFLSTLNTLLKEAPTKKQKLLKLEGALKDAAIKDAERIEEVVSVRDLGAKQWRDVNELDTTDENKQKLRQQIETKVKNGERLIKSANISLNVSLEE